jgi:predicted deacylase
MVSKRRGFRIGTERVRRGESREIRLELSSSYTGDAISLPVHVLRGKKPGPVVVVTAAVHGDEINGTGILHELVFDSPPKLVAGTLVLVPVVNVFGFETQSRYMPDRRDLNRFFPGSAAGSLTSRVAHTLFSEVIEQADFGIDLHTAAEGRTNFPNVRGDLRVPGVRRLARAFGCELIVHGGGPSGSLRREAVRAGCPTILLEAGEPSRMEPAVQQVGVWGIRNVLAELGLVRGEAQKPAYQVLVRKSTWVRAERAGILRFHVSPGEIVEAGQPLATNVSVFGQAQSVLISPEDGIVLGMTTLPAVKPGEPVCHLALPTRSIKRIRRSLERSSAGTVYQRTREDFTSSVTVTDSGA